MEISSQITVTVKPQGSASGLNAGTFKTGDTFRLKILELQGDRALIGFGKFRASADIKIPVTRGDELLVRVLQTGPQLKLGIVNTALDRTAMNGRAGQAQQIPGVSDLNEARAQVKEALTRLLTPSVDGKPLPSSVREALAALQGHFEPLDLKISITELLPQLKASLENSGFFLEKKLENLVLNLPQTSDTSSSEDLVLTATVKKILSGDFKAGLLQLRQLAVDSAQIQNMLGSKALASLTGGIDTLLSDIIHQQGRAVKQLEGPDLFQAFTFTLPLKEGDHAAHLKVYYPQKKKGDRGGGFRISVLLSLDRIGDIRTDFVLLENDLNITFFVKKTSAQTNILENQHQLSAVLAKFFDRVGLNVMVSEKKVLEFDHQDILTDNKRKVDVRI